VRLQNNDGNNSRNTTTRLDIKYGYNINTHEYSNLVRTSIDCLYTVKSGLDRFQVFLLVVNLPQRRPTERNQFEYIYTMNGMLPILSHVWFS